MKLEKSGKDLRRMSRRTVIVTSLVLVLLLGLAGVSFAAPPRPNNVIDVKLVDQLAAPNAPAAPMGKSTLGNYVWYDADVDGDWTTSIAEEEFKGGIDGVLINLYLDLNNNGVIDAGEYLSSTTTGDDSETTDVVETGWYSFDVTADKTQYIVEIAPSNFLPGNALAGLTLTSGDVYGSSPLVVYLPDLVMNYVDADFGYAPASILIEKTPDLQYALVNGTATFTIKVTNTGNVPLANVSVTDALAPSCNRAAGTIPLLLPSPGTPNSFTYTCTVVVTADMTNLAATSGQPADTFGVPLPGTSPVTDDDTAVVDVINPSILIEKTPDLQYVVVGSTATFTIKVTNTGDVPLANVSVTDALAPSCDRAAGTIPTLQVNPTTPYYYEYTCTVTVTADMTNIANVTGQPSDTGGTPLPGTSPVTDDDNAVVDAINPSILIEKTPDLQYALVNGTATFTIKVTNTGNVPLANVSVTDALAPSCNRAAGTIPLLLPSPGTPNSFTYTCTVVVTADMTNLAATSGQPADTFGVPLPGTSPVTDDDTAVVDVINPSILIEKTPDLQYVVVGSTATFTIKVTNTGDVPLANVSVTDALAPSCDRAAGTIPTLQVNPTTPYYYEYTCTVTVTADMTNIANVTGQPSDTGGTPLPGTSPVTDDDSAVVDAINPSILIEKTPDLQYALVNGTATFTIKVTNTGNVPLANVSVTDALAPSCNRAAGTIPLLLPSPGTPNSFTYTCTVVVTADMTNLAATSGQPADTFGVPLPGTSPVTDDDTAVVDVINPSILIEKTPDLQYVVVGSTATFTIKVTNTGDVPLANVSVTDALAPSCNRAAGTIPLLLPSPGTPNSFTYTCTVAVTADMTNLAATSGQPSDTGGTPLPGTSPVTDDDTAVVDVITPSILIEKTPDLQYALVNGTATFTIKVTNTGLVPLANVSVTDALAPSCNRAAGTIPLLLPSPGTPNSFTYTCTVVVTADMTNVASTSGQPADNGGTPLPGTSPVTDDDTAVVDVINPSIQLLKTVGPSTAVQTPDGEIYYIPAPGGAVRYKYVVTNTGDTNLNDVYITDNILGDICGPMTLPIGQSSTCYAPATTISLDTTNIGTATGQPVDGSYVPIPGVGPVTDDDDAVVDVYRATYTIEKTLMSPSPVRPGELVQFRIRVRNTGDVYLAVVPLIDTYDTGYLTYGYDGSFSTPSSNDNGNDGVLNWTDLTGPTPGGFNVDLAPGTDSFFDVFVDFTAATDTTLLANQETINVARVEGARADLDGPTGPRPPETTPLASQEASDGVQIIYPTGIEIAGLSAVVQDGGVLLAWETAGESNIIGFNVLRSMDGGELAAVNAELIVAQYAGAVGGAAYSFVDEDATGATYVLEVLRLDGSVVRVAF